MTSQSNNKVTLNKITLKLPVSDLLHSSQLALSFFLRLHPAPPPEQQSTFWDFFLPLMFIDFLHPLVLLLTFLKQNPSPAPASTIK